MRNVQSSCEEVPLLIRFDAVALHSFIKYEQLYHSAPSCRGVEQNVPGRKLSIVLKLGERMVLRLFPQYILLINSAVPPNKCCSIKAREIMYAFHLYIWIYGVRVTGCQDFDTTKMNLQSVYTLSQLAKSIYTLSIIHYQKLILGERKLILAPLIAHSDCN